MAKQCPLEAKDKRPHPTKEVVFGNIKYDFCTICQEDVEVLINRQNQPPVAAAPTPVGEEEPELLLDPAPAPVAEEANPDFEEMDADEDDDDGHNPFVNPPGYNPRPTRNMGNAQGTHKVVLVNDPNTGHMVVTSVLQKVFGKSAEEAHYVMSKVHFEENGVEVFYVNPADWPTLQQQIEDVKREWIAQGCPPEHVNGLTFNVEPR